MRISDWSSDVCSSDLDTEIIVHLIARSRAGNVIDRIVGALHKVEGAYSLGALTQKKLIGVRDPFGVRPLVLGRLGDAWILRSEERRVGKERVSPFRSRWPPYHKKTHHQTLYPT